MRQYRWARASLCATWLSACLVLLHMPPARASDLVETTTQAPELRSYRAYSFSGSGFPSFNVFRAAPIAGAAASAGMVVYVPGSGCGSNFEIRHGKAEPGWFDRIRQLAGPGTEFVAADRPGVKLFAQPIEPGRGDDCSPEFNEVGFDEVARGLAALVDDLVRQRSVPPSFVLLIGSSDGAPVAALAASRSASVTHVAMLSGGGDNQLEELLLSASTGKSSDSNERLRSVFRLLDTVTNPSSSPKVLWGQPIARWRSALSVSITQALLDAKAAVYVVGGTDDDSVPIASMDLLAARLLRAKKSVVLERIPHADHALRVGSDRPSLRLEMTLASILRWAKGERVEGVDIVLPLPQQ